MQAFQQTYFAGKCPFSKLGHTVTYIKLYVDAGENQ